MKQVSATIIAAFLLSPFAAQAGSVRISFLDTGVALRDTLKLMNTCGCNQEGVDVFRRAVTNYYRAGFEFDYSKFPAPVDGFYRFESATQLVAALPYRLCCSTKHAFDLNCFDVVILLATPQLRTKTHADELNGPLLVPLSFTNETSRTFALEPLPTARDAFKQFCPGWYLEATDGLFSKHSSASRISLTATLFSCQLFPSSTSESTLAKTVHDVLRTNWRRWRITFPKNFEVVLCHEVVFPSQLIVPTHAGLLFPNRKGFTYLEKAGGPGPFVRLDFDDKSDLIIWLSAEFRGESGQETHSFVTFNDTTIAQLKKLK